MGEGEQLWQQNEDAWNNFYRSGVSVTPCSSCGRGSSGSSSSSGGGSSAAEWAAYYEAQAAVDAENARREAEWQRKQYEAEQQANREYQQAMMGFVFDMVSLASKISSSRGQAAPRQLSAEEIRLNGLYDQYTAMRNDMDKAYREQAQKIADLQMKGPGPAMRRLMGMACLARDVTARAMGARLSHADDIDIQESVHMTNLALHIDGGQYTPQATSGCLFVVPTIALPEFKSVDDRADEELFPGYKKRRELMTTFRDSIKKVPTLRKKIDETKKVEQEAKAEAERVEKEVAELEKTPVPPEAAPKKKNDLLEKARRMREEARKKLELAQKEAAAANQDYESTVAKANEAGEQLFAPKKDDVASAKNR